MPSFAYSIYQSDAVITYTSVGSGAGKCRIKDYCANCVNPFVIPTPTVPSQDLSMPRNLDFAGSDSTLTSAEYAAYPDLQMYPAVAGAVVPIFNLPGISTLTLTPSIVSRIFRQCKTPLNETVSGCLPGSIYRWNDTAIVNLNPTIATQLATFGPIEVVVRSDSSGTTDIFKRALSSFEASFATQVGLTASYSSNTWKGVKVMVAEDNSGVAGYVSTTIGTMGYVSLAEAQLLSLNAVQLVKTVGATPIVANTQSVVFAAMEMGLNFGNNGDAPSRLTANIFNAPGSFSWPISGYTYFVVRSATARFGADCSNRKATFDYLSWFFTDASVDALATRHGFAPLPAEVKRVILQNLRSTFKCAPDPKNPTALKLVYQPQSRYIQQVVANAAALDLVDLLQQVYTIKDASVQFTAIASASSSAVYEKDFLNAGSPLLQLRLRGDFVNVTQSAKVSVMPFAGVAMLPLFNICGTVSCFSGSLSLTPTVIASILDGTITMWNDPQITALSSSGQPFTMPNQKIQVLRVSNPELNMCDNQFEQQLKAYKSSFQYMAGARTFKDFVSVMYAVYAVPYSFAVIPRTASAYKLAVPAAINTGSQSVMATDASILSQQYPFVQYVDAAFPHDFNGNDCVAAAGVRGVRSAEYFAKLMFWFFDPNNMQDALSTAGIAFMANKDAVTISQYKITSRLVSCNGQSIMEPAHDLTVLSAAWKIGLYVLLGISEVGCLALLIWVYTHRKHPVIKASSVDFLLNIIVGAMVSLATIATLLQDDSSLYAKVTSVVVADQTAVIASTRVLLNVSCMASNYLFFIGYGMIFTPLLLKAWRVNSLFNNRKMKKLTISNTHLFALEAAVLSVYLLTLLLWTFIDPMQYKRTILATDPISGLPTKSVGICANNNYAAYMVPLIVFVMLTLIVGNYLSYHGRNVPVKFSEGKWIAVALVNFLECFLLCIPIMFITANQPTMDAIVKTMFVFVCNIGTVVIIFGSRIQLFMAGEKELKKIAVSSITSKSTAVTSTAPSTTERTVDETERSDTSKPSTPKSVYRVSSMSALVASAGETSTIELGRNMEAASGKVH